MSDAISKLSEQLVHLKVNMSRGFAAIMAMINERTARIDRVDRVQESMRAEITSLRERLARLEEAALNHKEDVTEIKKDVHEIRKDATGQHRIVRGEEHEDDKEKDGKDHKKLSIERWKIIAGIIAALATSGVLAGVLQWLMNLLGIGGGGSGGSPGR